MNSLIKADIFFFVSTIALVVISIGIAIALVYLIRILRNVKDVSEKVKEEGTEIVNDVRAFRSDVKKEGFRVGKFAGLMRRIFGRGRKK